MADEFVDVVIIGGGPAGLTAAIYVSRMDLKALVLEAKLLGGRAVEAPIVENFPGFPEGVSGAELMDRTVKQAEKSGVQIKSPEEVRELELKGIVKNVATKSSRYQSYSVIIATGSQRKKLSVIGEAEFLGRGVSYCTICDGPLFKGKETAVIGHGDEAFEDAFSLSPIFRVR